MRPTLRLRHFYNVYDRNRQYLGPVQGTGFYDALKAAREHSGLGNVWYVTRK